MVTTYPAQVDTLITLPEVNQTTGLRPELFNRLREAIVRVEEELGVKPSATYGTVRTRLDYLEYKISNGLLQVNGDLGLNSITKEISVIGLRSNKIADTPLVDGYVLNWDSQHKEWVPRFLAVDNLLPPFVVLMEPLSPLSVLIGVGETLSNPAFTADYSILSSDLDSVHLSDDQGNPEIDVTSFPYNFIYDGYSYTKNSSGETVTITCTAINKRYIQKTSSVTFTWTQKLYWGASSIPLSYNASFLNSLSNKEPTLSFKKTIAVDAAGSGNYIFFACDQSYGTPVFNVNGMDGGFSVVGSVIIGTDTLSIYRSDFDNLGETVITIS